MTQEDVKRFFDSEKEKGASDDDILATLYRMFQNDALTFDQFETLCLILGYELNEEFKSLSLEEQKKTENAWNKQ